MSLLSRSTFSESTHDGFLDSIFDRVRIRLREAAKFVRMEAAWRTWPTVHKIAKPLHEALITDGDRAAERNSEIHAMAERCARFYPTEGHLIRALQAHDGREEIALTIGGGLDEGNSNYHGITLDDVLALYRSQYAITAEQYVAQNLSLCPAPETS